MIGVMHMVDQGEIDDKIIAVAKNDAAFSNVNELKVLFLYYNRIYLHIHYWKSKDSLRIIRN